MNTPQHENSENAGQPDLVLASRLKRLVGAVLDSAVLLAAMYPFFFFSGILDRLQDGELLSVRDRVVFTLLVWAIFTILHGHLLLRTGQTIGKRLVGTRIVDPHGRILPLERVIVLRYFLFAIIGHIPFLGVAIQILDVLFIFAPDRRCLHDHVAGTIVVDAGTAPMWPWPSTPQG